MERKNRISFLDLEIIKLDNSKIVSNWYGKKTYFGRLVFISSNPFQNKVVIMENLVNRADCLSHESLHSENLDIVRNILFFNHYLQGLIEKHIKIRIEQVKNRQDSNVDMDTQSEVFIEHNTFDPQFLGQI